MAGCDPAAVQSASAKGGMAVVLNPKTGEILAMASCPDFDLNNFGKAAPELQELELARQAPGRRVLPRAAPVRRELKTGEGAPATGKGATIGSLPYVAPEQLVSIAASNAAGYMYASNNDQVKLWQEFEAVLWYRPIESLKFGLQYAYTRTDYLQKLNNPVPLPQTTQSQSPQNNAGAKDFGDSHRVQFVAYMYF